MNCDFRVLGEPRRSTVSTVVFSFMKLKLIFYRRCWHTWCVILKSHCMSSRVWFCFVPLSTEMICCCSSQHQLAFGYLYVPFCLVENYPLGEGVDAIHNGNHSHWALRVLVILACQPHKLETSERHDWVNHLCFFLKTRTLARHV